MERAETNRRRRWFLFTLGACGLALLGTAALWSVTNSRLVTSQTLYNSAQAVQGERRAQMYSQLEKDLPVIEEYTRMWMAEQALPNLDAIETLHTVIAYRPQSPAAYLAHIALARYYADMDAPQAEDQYRTALDLYDTVALRRELANHLEEQGNYTDAYQEYRLLLSRQADAFTGMRRTGSDPLKVAEDLIDATYFSDALEALRNVTDAGALPLRARALMGLGQYDEARIAYEAWLTIESDDEDAQLGLARVLSLLDRVDEAMAIYEKLDTADSQLSRATMLRDSEPEEALSLYLESPYPIAWWSATAMLEAQGRLTETLPVYARLARSDTAYAADAAYRMVVLAQRVGEEAAEAEGHALLDGLGFHWLALRAADDEFDLNFAPPMDGTGDILEKVYALEKIGRDDLAELELLMAAHVRRSPDVVLAMAQELAARGNVEEAQNIAATYLREYPHAPQAYWELSYPRPYSATVEAAAKEFGADPLLIWAVMREESRFDADALSFAGACGLMQVIPATQEWIAGALEEKIAPGDAFVPQTSIRMGAWLLNFLTEYFDGDKELAVLAYNAGAGSVEIWESDPLVNNRDDLIRWIGYDETRLYLKRVGLSYWVYQQLYGPT